jgi:predicted DNA-binding transcriptional regulator AlpA
METAIRIQTDNIVAKLLRPLVEIDLITVPESQEIVANLRHLAEKGTLMPVIPPKLVTQDEAAEMLGIGLSNFKKLEKEGKFSFKRRTVGGTAVRYRNTDIFAYIAANDDLPANPEPGSQPAQPVHLPVQ